MGRPAVHDKRDIVKAIFYVGATGCQWRALPERYPHWNTVHRYDLRWSRDGTWERICDRLRGLLREAEGRDAESSAGVIDATSVRGAATVTSSTRGYDPGKKVSGRKTFGARHARTPGGGRRSCQAEVEAPPKIFCDAGLEKAFAAHYWAHHLSAEVVKKIHSGTSEVLPRRSLVERTWSWFMNNRRLQVDDERLPVVAEGFVWAARARLLLRRLTAQPATIHRVAQMYATASEVSHRKGGRMVEPWPASLR